jgi:hypothetical protein
MQIAMMGLQAMGTLMQKQQADRAEEARQSAMNAEIQRQGELDAQAKMREKAARDALDEAVPQFGKDESEKRRQGIQQSIEGALNPVVDEAAAKSAAYTADSNPGAPTEVKDSLARTFADSLSRGKTYAKNLANLSSFGQATAADGIAMSKLGTNIGVENAGIGRINGQMGLSNQLFQTKLAQSQIPNRNRSTVADLFNGAGQAGMLYTLTRPNVGSTSPVAGGINWDIV